MAAASRKKSKPEATFTRSHAYRVKVNPLAHELKVELTVTGGAGELLVQTPTWVPGAYGLMKYGRDLVDVKATDANGRILPMKREGWSGFRISEVKGPVQISFTAYGYDPAWGELSGLVNHTYAVLLATRYLYAPALPGPLSVEYALPKGWKLHHPSGATALSKTAFEYPSFAALLDTPVICGAFEVKTRKVQGTAFHHVFLDRAVGFASEVDGFLDTLVKVAEEAKRVFGSFPFSDYTYVFSFNPNAHWGLEHANSTMIGLGENAFIDPESRMGAVRVCAHELMHAWNVCRLKPEALAQPDFVVAPVIDELWIAEGFTRYYEFLLGVRAGAIAPEQFFSNLINYYRHLEAMPAFKRVSPLDSSQTTFLNHNKYPGSINTTLDYYDVGMLIAFATDAFLRTHGEDGGLDAVFARFYERFVEKPGGYTHADAMAMLEPIGTAAWLRREVEKPNELSAIDALAELGFELEREDVAYVGLVLKDNSGAEIANVLDDAPAGRTGIAPGDVILTAGGFPFSFKSLTWLIKQSKPFAVRVQRGHTEYEFTLAPGTQSRLAKAAWQGTDEQLALWRTWLRRPELALKPGQSLSLTSFQNFHGIQTVL